MRVFRVQHDGIWFNGYSIVVADTIESAVEMMRAELRARDLNDTQYELIEVPLGTASVTMLWNGDY